MKPRAIVVIPNWNGIDMLGECLDALARQTIKHHVILVDNGSKDGSLELVRDHYPEVQLIALPTNTGFAGGVNRGIRSALEQGADYVALMNNDAVADEHWLEHLAAAADAHPEAGAAAAKILTQDGKKLDSTGDFYSTWGFPFPRGRDEVDQGQYDSPEHQWVFAVSGGASLYRAKMLEQIGLFDERFFAYYEDQDIGFRGQLAGWKMLYEPQATVRHYVGGTSERMDTYKKTGSTALATKADHAPSGQPSAFARYHSIKNFAYLYTKNMPGWLYWKYLPRFWASWAMMMVSDARRGLLVSNLRANLVALAHLPGILADRWRIQARRSVSDAYIDSILYHDLPPQQKLRFRRFRRQ